MRRVAIGVLAVAALAVAELLSASGGSARRAAPPLPARTLGGGPPVSLATLRGRPAVVTFWAAWCGPCHREAPELERFARSGARLVGVDWTDGERGARAFVRRYGWSFPVLADPEGAVGNAYRLTGLPTTFVLDARGRIANVLRGPQTAASLRRAVATAS